MSKTPSIGEIIVRSRNSRGMTLDQYAQRIGISGPGVWKFEKGYANPSFALWRRIAADARLGDRRATLIWIRGKTPEGHKHYIEELYPPEGPPGRLKNRRIDYSTFENASECREAIQKDKTLPKAFRDALAPDDIWEGFRPVGHEINLVRDLFTPLGKGSIANYLDAFRLVREFCHSF